MLIRANNSSSYAFAAICHLNANEAKPLPIVNCPIQNVLVKVTKMDLLEKMTTEKQGWQNEKDGMNMHSVFKLMFGDMANNDSQKIHNNNSKTLLLDLSDIIFTGLANR
jgi:hypothetical protein